MKPIILVMLMSVSTMYLLLHNTARAGKTGIKKIVKNSSDTVTTKALFNDQFITHGIWMRDLIW